MPFIWVSQLCCLHLRAHIQQVLTGFHTLKGVLHFFPSGQRGAVLICWWAQRNVFKEQRVSSGPTWFIIHTVNWVFQQQCWEFNDSYYTKHLRSRWIIYCYSSYFMHLACSIICLCDSFTPPWLMWLVHLIVYGILNMQDLTLLNMQ